MEVSLEDWEVDWSDAWTEEDLADATGASVSRFEESEEQVAIH